MNTIISVPIPTSLFLELADVLEENNDPRDPVEVVRVAVEYWLLNASMRPDDLLQQTDARGYQWKSLFLPEGTQIRMQYNRAYFYAKVEGDEIWYDGKSVSPGTMANTIAHSSRNAWRDLWIKRPGDKEWKLADECRAEAKALGEKLVQEIERL